jgi:hypothetical protein
MPQPTTPADDDTQADLRLEPPLPHTPFASYMSHDWLHSATRELSTASEDENSDADGEAAGTRRHRVRESVVFSQSVNWTSTSSTSSLVSAGGRPIGRPMGIPPPPPTDFSRVAAMSRSSLRWSSHSELHFQTNIQPLGRETQSICWADVSPHEGMIPSRGCESVNDVLRRRLVVLGRLVLGTHVIWVMFCWRGGRSSSP